MRSRKPIGRIRTLAVLAALSVSVLGGALPASAADDSRQLPPGLARQGLVQADDSLARGWDWADADDADDADSDGGTVSTFGWNWAR